MAVSLTPRNALCWLAQFPFVAIYINQLFLMVYVERAPAEFRYDADAMLSCVVFVAIIEWLRRHPPPPATVHRLRLAFSMVIFAPFALSGFIAVFHLATELSTLAEPVATGVGFNTRVTLYVLFVGRLYQTLRLFWATPKTLPGITPLPTTATGPAGNGVAAWAQLHLRRLCVTATTAALCAAFALYHVEALVQATLTTAQPAACATAGVLGIVVTSIVLVALAAPVTATWRSLPVLDAQFGRDYHAWLGRRRATRLTDGTFAPGVPRRLVLAYLAQCGALIACIFLFNDIAYFFTACATPGMARPHFGADLWLLTVFIAGWPCLHLALFAEIARMR